MTLHLTFFLAGNRLTLPAACLGHASVSVKNTARSLSGSGLFMSKTEARSGVEPGAGRDRYFFLFFFPSGSPVPSRFFFGGLG